MNVTLQMKPGPGGRLQRFVGDRVRFAVEGSEGAEPIWTARLRTNLGNAELLRREIIEAHTHGLPFAGASWHDLPMHREGGAWVLDVALTEPGYFRAKPYLLDQRGWQHWPEGQDVGVSVHPSHYRTGNTIYCAFARMFGKTRGATDSARLHSKEIERLDQTGYVVIPPSGTLRDLAACLPHIFDTLGCRILQLLPVNPTPTTYARFGRFGSPYAALDLTAIDPALTVFDKRTTGIDQFRELAYAVHLRGGRLFLDVAINHTGWGSMLQTQHPEWFLRRPDGTFASPGAWGTVWEDLIELKHVNVELWDELAEVFLTWCHRGVDGFRCDAGYKVPVAAWQYIIARVQREFPDTVFLLEGLGGAWEATEALLTEGGMQWAYSELFQNYTPEQVSSYLDHSFRESGRVGVLVHYSETHDNNRLAVKGRAWSVMRNRLCALASSNGGFAFTCGVEWLATEKVDVHGSPGMAWGANDNIVPELATLNGLLSDHPCFFDEASVSRLSANRSPVCVLRRDSAERLDTVLIFVNTDLENEAEVSLEESVLVSTLAGEGGAAGMKPKQWVDLLGQKLPKATHSAGRGTWTFSIPAGGAYCLATAASPRGSHGATYRQARARAAWAYEALGMRLPPSQTGSIDWRWLEQQVDEDPRRFLAAVSRIAPVGSDACISQEVFSETLEAFRRNQVFPKVVCWSAADASRVTPVPPDHWLLIREAKAFRATLRLQDGGPTKNVQSVLAAGLQTSCFHVGSYAGLGWLILERYGETVAPLEAKVRFLASGPTPLPRSLASSESSSPFQLKPSSVMLFTNGRGGMARICADLGRIRSKYDCLLGANLDPELPVDRHILVKRLRAWLNADGFITPLDFRSLTSVIREETCCWDFILNAGDGRTVELALRVAMPKGRNAILIELSRPNARRVTGRPLPDHADVRVTVRFDIEDRNFHCETKHNGGAEFHFNAHTRTLAQNVGELSAAKPRVGFLFAPAADRQVCVWTETGEYHPQPEWSDNIAHPVEASRGQEGAGDAFSPGWFDLPLRKGANALLTVDADGGLSPIAGSPVETRETDRPWHGSLRATLRGTGAFGEVRECVTGEAATARDDLEQEHLRGKQFEEQLARSASAFVVKRGAGQTVIAGYPWFLDWGRDTLICARGLLAAGKVEDVRQLLITFARFERDGTLPNTIHGEDASNRDTSDAPLWFGVVCQEMEEVTREETAKRGAFLDTPVDGKGRTIRSVLESIARHYVAGTPNGIRVDPESGLVWSPSHFTWMDTNYPAGTPREGYPVEIQALWVRLLRFLGETAPSGSSKRWAELADRALGSIESLYWMEEEACYSDVLLTRSGQTASQATRDDALRSNCLLLPAFGLADRERARRCVRTAAEHLVVPGALRSLAPLPVSVPLRIEKDGRLLNDPLEPYWGRYEGDEDTRRKPAYHNGTAWTWTFPAFCEALARAWDFDPDAVAAARAYLGSTDWLFAEGCLGQLPEIVDGDAPHTQRGCDAQAWSVTEVLRVWKLLNGFTP